MRNLRRVLKIVAGTLGGLGGLALGAVLLWNLGPIRNGVLRAAVEQVTARVPGTLDLRVEAPGPRTVIVSDVLWVVDADTLLVAERVEATVRLRPLWRGELEVESAVATGIQGDVPSLRQHLAAGGRNEDTSGPAGPASLPPVAVQSLRVTAHDVRLTPSEGLARAELDASFDLRARPSVTLQRLEATGRDDRWGLTADELIVDMAAWRFHGQARGFLGGPVSLRLAVSAQGEDSLDVTLAVEGDAAEQPPCGQSALHGQVTLLGEDRVEADLDLTIPDTACLRRLPWLTERLHAVGDLAATRGAVRIRMDLDPVQGTVELDLEPSDWIDAGLVRARFDPSSATIDSLRLALRGLQLDAAGDLQTETIQASVQLRADTARWMSLVPGVTALHHLDFSGDIQLDGPRDSPRLQTTFRGEAAGEGWAVDAVEFRAGAPGLRTHPTEVSLGLGILEHRVQLRGDVEWPTDSRAIRASLDPILVLASNRRAPTSRVSRGEITFDPQTGATLTDLRIEGSTGSAIVSGQLQREGDSQISVAVRWPRFPSVLPQFVEMTAAQRDSLEIAWDPGTRLDGVVTLAMATRDATVEGTFRLPGPARLRSLLPANMRVADLQALKGKARFTSRGDRRRVDLQLDQTQWLDRATLRGGGSADRFLVEELQLEAMGVTLSGTGVVGDVLDFDTRLDVHDPRIVERFAPGSLDSLVVLLETRITGSRAQPSLVATVSGAARGPSLRVPALTGDVSLDADGWRASLVARDGTLGSLATTWARVDVQAPETKAEAGRFSLVVAAPTLELRQAGAFQRGDPVVVRADTLTIVVADGDLALTRPFEVRAGAERTDIEGLRLAGSLGTADLDGAVGPGLLDLTASVDLKLPGVPPVPTIPVDYWPASVQANLRARGRQDVRLDATVAEMPWAGEPLTLALSAHTERDSLLAAVVASQVGEPRLRMQASIPSDRLEVAFPQLLDDVRFHGSFDCFPVPLAADPSAAERVACLDGRFRAARLRSQPTLEGGLEISFPGWPRLDAYSLRIQVLDQNKGRLPEAGPGATAIGLTTSLTRNRAPVLEGRATYRVEPGVDLAAGVLDASVNSRELNLADLSDLLPADTSVQGTLAVELEAAGPLEDPTLKGHVEGPVEVATADGTRIRGHGSIDLSGSLRRPAAAGNVTIERGTLRIPESPKALHPTEGTATLWAQSDPTVESVPEPTAAGRTGGDAITPDLDISLTIASGVWIRGRGLDAELAGRLGVRQKDAGAPEISGDLRAIRGSLIMLGRTFRVERGGVVFDGGPDIDPELDLALTTGINEILIRVIFEGTAQNPQLRLESEPELPESDIVSYLLFGRPVDQLDTDQTSFLESRATDIAASMGLAGLEARVARQLGMDLVRMRREEGASGVVLGKYLSPKVLLQYEQYFSEGKDSRLNLEYLLFQGFKIDTLFGRESQSGIGLSWERNY